MYNKIIKRDVTLDRLRGFAMLWVILIHTLYWGGITVNGHDTILKSFLLFEMPLFFFIIGASNSMARVTTYKEFIKKRFTKLLIPYWIFAVICIISNFIYYLYSGELNLLDLALTIITWIIPIIIPMSPVSLNNTVWFIPVYLCIIVMFPILKKSNRSIGKYGVIFLIVIYAAIVILIDKLLYIPSLLPILNNQYLLRAYTNILNVIQEAAFYLIWTYIGLYYKEIKEAFLINKKKIPLFISCILSVICIFICYKFGYSLDMQSNKFPPNIMFLFYSLAAMSALGLILPFLDTLLAKLEDTSLGILILEQYSKHSISIFLYQSFAFYITIRLTNYIFPYDSLLFTILKIVFCFISTVLLCTVLAMIFGRFENINFKSTKSQKQ